jgi:ATP-dependent protease ClpP protease subunit
MTPAGLWNECEKKEDVRMKNLWKIDVQMAADKSSARMSISGYIAARYYSEQKGVTAAEDVKAELKKLPDSVKTITVELNSRGGSIPEGVEIYEALMGSGKTVEVNVTGAAYSVASVILLAGSVRRISAMGQVMIHRPTVYAGGTAEDLRKAAEMLEKTEGQVLDLYESKTGMDRKTLEADMKKTTFYTAKEAVNNGFATEILGAPAGSDDRTGDAQNVLELSAERERLLAGMGWRLPAEAAAAFFGNETDGDNTQNGGDMNFALVNKLKGIFGAEKALEMAEKKPDAQNIGDFEAELSAHVEAVNKRAVDAENKAGELGKAKAEADVKITALETQLKEAGKAPAVLLGGGDPSTPPAKPATAKEPPAGMTGEALAEFKWENDPVLKAEFQGHKDAFLAYAKSVNFNL